MNKDLNRFIVKCYCEDKVLIDISVDNLMGANYVSSLSFCNAITFNGKKYSIEDSEMIHKDENPLVIEVIVKLKEIRESKPRISVLT